MSEEPLKQQTAPKTRTLAAPDFTLRASAGRDYAEKMVRMQSERVNRRVILRAKALVAVVALSLIFGGYAVSSLLFHPGGDVLLGSVLAFNAVFQVVSAGYFILARDQSTVSLLLKILLILNGLQLLMGLFMYGPVALMLLCLAAQGVAYTQVESLRDTI